MYSGVDICEECVVARRSDGEGKHARNEKCGFRALPDSEINTIEYSELGEDRKILLEWDRLSNNMQDRPIQK